MIPKRKSPSEDRLILELNTRNYTNKPKGINHLYTGKNRLLVLESIAERWSARGLYATPTRAMIALLTGESMR